MPNRDPVLGDGSSMIPFEVLGNLPADVAVTLLTFAGPVQCPADVRGRCEAVHELSPRGHPWALARSVFSVHDVGAQERATAAAITAASELSAQCDATLVHGPHVLFLAHHVRSPMVLQTVDPWSIRIGMESALVRGWRAAYRRLKGMLALRAARQLPARARLLTVGAQDAAEWSKLLGRPVRSIPNGARPVTRTADRDGSPTVCFVGSLNYAPNIDSAKALIGKIAPLVWHEVPEARFVIAGRLPPPEILSLAGQRVDVLANVPSVAEVFQLADVAAFPDEFGVGIRNSVREALAAGLPVVATPVAAREQDAHCLLTVEGDTGKFVEHVLRHLSAERADPCNVEGDLAAGRTWKAAAQDYMDELRDAISGTVPVLKAAGHELQ
ncbi:glycosyltransferase [Arthrobacter globiformis]|uniref:glycosyltransferase n=1 Tax=Arthrobacter globiformis TaxID=1665 RepID=UPI00397D3B3C